LERSSIIAPLTVAIVLPLVFKLFSRLFPYQPPPQLSEAEVARLRRRAQVIDLCLLPVFFVGVACATWLWALALNGMAERNLAQQPPSRFLLKPEPYFVFWLIPALFLGIITFGLLLMALMRLLMGKERYREYEVGAQARFNVQNRAWIWVLGVTSFVIAVAIFLAQDWYTRFEEDRIAVNPLLSVGERIYSYQDVQRLVETTHLKAPNGNIVDRKRWFILFKDRQWCNEDLASREGQERVEQEVRDFLCKKTGKQFEQVRFIEDVLGK
jgi:hypothetical protein